MQISFIDSICWVASGVGSRYAEEGRRIQHNLSLCHNKERWWTGETSIIENQEWNIPSNWGRGMNRLEKTGSSSSKVSSTK